MEDHETVLSEVHVGIPGVSSTATNIISRFEFAVPRVATSPLVRPQLTRSFSKDSNEMDTEMSAQTISIGYAVGTTESESTTMKLLKLENPSGDMNEIDKYSKADETTAADQSPPRKTRANEVILIEHHMATHLVKVGLQVWPAALLMADFLIHHGSRWKNCIMLELGGGVGLCGIVSAMFAQRTICSDYLAEIVELMKRNFQRNSTLLKGEYECRLIDVRFPLLTSLKSSYSSSSTLAGVTDNEMPVCDVIFASDIIYSDEITEALMTYVKSLLRQRPRREFYLSLERRLNFTTKTLTTSCPAYDYFVELCHQLCLARESVDISQMPSYFQYERSAYLEMYRITLMPNNK